MPEFFRFRSIDALLGKFQELEKQTIYFASPDELNDPMEGLRNIVWNGDQIVWTHFFKHYIFCLNRSYWLLKTARKPTKLDADSIPILERWDQLKAPLEKSLFDDIWDRFCNLPNIQEVIETLENARHKIRYREILCYLRYIQNFALLDEIQKSYINHELISKVPIIQLPNESPAASIELLLNLIKQVKTIRNEEVLDAMFQTIEAGHENIGLTMQDSTHIISTGIFGNNDLLAMYDLPRVYVEQLDRLLWPKWYTACFTDSYHNSSVWAKYADGHKGACLIFGAEEKDNMNSLVLHRKTRKSSRTIPFRKVNYGHGPGETDFFRTICKNITLSTLKKLWYTDQNGNISECAAHLESDQSQAAWRKNYWNNFFGVTTTKTTDWAYEKEYRLVLEDDLSEFDKKDDRILTYDFVSLKGIIFGMRTSIEDQREIFDLIEKIEKKKKCDRNNQTDFKYFQAYYSAKDGNIHKRRIRLG